MALVHGTTMSIATLKTWLHCHGWKVASMEFHTDVGTIVTTRVQQIGRVPAPQR